MTHECHSKPNPNTYWVLPGRLLAGEYPGAIRTPLAVEKLNAFLDNGIDSFIDLTVAGELQPYEHLLKALGRTRRLRLEHRRFAIPDMSIPEAKLMKAILAQIDAWLMTNRRIYVHCWGGIGRTGTVIGCHLVHGGLSGHQALARMAELWQGVSAQKRRRYPHSPQTAEQQHYVRCWVPPAGLGVPSFGKYMIPGEYVEVS